jgi:AraC-like DNA-binding protein
MEVVESERDVRLVLTETTPLKPYSHFFAEVVFVSFYNILHYLLGEDEEPLRINFAYAEPAHADVYRRYFRCPLKFGASQSAIVLSRRTAVRPLVLANRNVAQLAESQIFIAPRTTLSVLQQQLRKVLRQSYGDFPALEKVARMLGTSGRTLRRQLRAYGTSYQIELDAVRKEIAISHLESSDASITDIANILGYNDSAAFSRAFKKWTDLSPSQYRQQYASQNVPVVGAD